MMCAAYALRHPERVDHLLLVSPAGVPVPPHVTTVGVPLLWRVVRRLWNVITPHRIVRFMGARPAVPPRRALAPPQRAGAHRRPARTLGHAPSRARARDAPHRRQHGRLPHRGPARDVRAAHSVMDSRGRHRVPLCICQELI